MTPAGKHLNLKGTEFQVFKEAKEKVCRASFLFPIASSVNLHEKSVLYDSFDYTLARSR